MGREKAMQIIPTGTPKKVYVIGGGPAGMEAARVAALRGHKVTLFEKSGRLGGRLWLASMIKGSDIEDVKPVIKYLTRQINERSSVTVRLNTEVTPELISREKPDVVVIATGGNYALPDVPGIHRWERTGREVHGQAGCSASARVRSRHA